MTLHSRLERHGGSESPLVGAARDPSAETGPVPWIVVTLVGIAAMLLWWGSQALHNTDWVNNCATECRGFESAVMGVVTIVAVSSLVAMSTWPKGSRLVPLVAGAVLGIGAWMVVGAPERDLWLPVVAGGIVAWRTEFPLHRTARLVAVASWFFLFGGSARSSPRAWAEDALLGGRFDEPFHGIVATLGPLFPLVVFEVVVALVRWGVRGERTGADRGLMVRHRLDRWIAGLALAVIAVAVLWLPGRLPGHSPATLANAIDAATPAGTDDVRESGYLTFGEVIQQLDNDEFVTMRIGRVGSPVLLGLFASAVDPANGFEPVPHEEATGTVRDGRYGCTIFFPDEGTCWEWEYRGSAGQYRLLISAGRVSEEEFVEMLASAVAEFVERVR